MLPEAERLPSEVVLDGGLLEAHRREALGQLRATLLDRPDDFEPDEWRVVVAQLAPPSGHLPRAAGSPAKNLAAVQRARECFPGLSAPAALRRYREVLDRPHIRAFLADFRALELADVQEQRGLVRGALTAILTRGTTALYQIDPEHCPNEWARVSATVVAAAKVLADLDALALKAEDVQTSLAPAQGDEDAGDGATLLDRVAQVAADLKRRREPAGAA